MTMRWKDQRGLVPFHSLQAIVPDHPWEYQLRGTCVLRMHSQSPGRSVFLAAAIGRVAGADAEDLEWVCCAHWSKGGR